MFYQEFNDLLEMHASTTGRLITSITGDFNFHWDNKDNPDTKHISEILHSFNLEQHASEPTHSSGHTLDWIVTRSDDNIISDVTISLPLSDHYTVQANLNVQRPSLPPKKVSYRRYKNIDVDTLRADIESSDLIQKPAVSLNELLDQYNNTLLAVVDKHAALITKPVTIRPACP